ncbi:MAG TPA: pyridoxal 5'-phosphate synthase glutaminase subunit PdxT [Solirubrobacterales bacterium]|nr:pyridoxal 5'-phosphate synthase glutaminase subunit PdxT [Solirubrobacterales bacterium]
MRAREPKRAPESSPLEAAGEARLRVGVLASQGDFAAHARMLAGLEAEPVEARTAGDLAGLDALVIPGGESTTISKAIERDRLEPAIRAHAEAGRPILGTCAGMIVCDRNHLGLLDATCRRNAFGRQLASFEADLEIDGIGPEPMRAVFIRAPWIEDHGEAVEVLARVGGHPVVVRQGAILACSFHPELTDDSRLHALLMALASAAESRAGSGSRTAVQTKEEDG